MAILHRKNSLACKTQNGARLGDLFMSLIHTCRLCFIAYWLSAKLELQWRQKDETIEAHNLLRQLQCIRLGRQEVERGGA
jgi:hypothetical protein